METIMNILIGITLMYFSICLVYIVGLCIYIHRLTERNRVRVNLGWSRYQYQVKLDSDGV